MGFAADAGISSRGAGHRLEPAQIQELVVERRHIRRLQNLTQLVNLRRASFADNQISHIEGEGCGRIDGIGTDRTRARVQGQGGPNARCLSAPVLTLWCCLISTFHVAKHSQTRGFRSGGLHCSGGAVPGGQPSGCY